MSARRPHGQSSNTSPTPAPAPGASDVSPAVPSDVIYKLLFFTAAMVIGPIGIYFLTVNTIFSGNSTYAGILAAVTANVVLFAYIYVAWLEDQGEQGIDKPQSKKSQ